MPTWLWSALAGLGLGLLYAASPLMVLTAVGAGILLAVAGRDLPADERRRIAWILGTALAVRFLLIAALLVINIPYLSDLGIGGLRAVRAYCLRTGYPEPEVFHMNEGHAGFLGLERLREYIETAGLDFDQALEATRSGTVFTTHTPVPAGIDRFPKELVERHFSGPVALPGLPVERVMALGAETYPGGDPNVFNMAVMGMRLAQRVNGVSALHGAGDQALLALPAAGGAQESDSATRPLPSAPAVTDARVAALKREAARRVSRCSAP